MRFRPTFERWRRSAPTTDTRRPTTNKFTMISPDFQLQKVALNVGVAPERPKGAERERFVICWISPALSSRPCYPGCQVFFILFFLFELIIFFLQPAPIQI